MDQETIQSLKDRLRALNEERANLVARLKKAESEDDAQEPSEILGKPTSEKVPQTSEEKISFFLKIVSRARICFCKAMGKS